MEELQTLNNVNISWQVAVIYCVTALTVTYLVSKIIDLLK